ncbi:hypothetical protein D3C72_1413770 [compost metagenome]
MRVVKPHVTQPMSLLNYNRHTLNILMDDYLLRRLLVARHLLSTVMALLKVRYLSLASLTLVNEHEHAV